MVVKIANYCKYCVKSVRIRSVFGVFLVRILHIWIEYGDLQSISVLSPNTGKYGPEKLRIQTLFTQSSQLMLTCNMLTR